MLQQNKFGIQFSNYLLTLPALILLFVLAACGPVEIPESTTPQPPAAATIDAYPVVVESSSGYPAALATADGLAPSGYPAPTTSDAPSDVTGPAFQFDLPLQADSTTITGRAPANLHLAIVDITYNGVVLGTGQSDSDGQFTISVSPLPESHRIGITLAEVEAGKTIEEMSVQLHPYRGEGFLNVPNVGIFFDTTLVESP